MKGFDDLIEEYGEVHFLKEEEHDEIAGLLSQAVRKYVMADLKLDGQDFNAMWAGDYIEGGPLKAKIKESMDALKPIDIIGHINYYFNSEYAIKNYYAYSVDVPGVNVLYEKGTLKSDKNIYNRLRTPRLIFTTTYEFIEPIDLNAYGTRIVLLYKEIKKEIEAFMKEVKLSVEGQKEVGLEEDKDVLLHGNQVMETLTENGVTFDVEKSGDLPKDPDERKTMIDNMRSDLESLKSDESIVNYTINEYNQRTVVKIFSKKLQDFSEEYSVDGFDFTRLND